MIEATPIFRWFAMFHRSSSAAGVRFLASIKEGRGLKPSARDAGIDKEVGYRWLREKYLELRRSGKSPADSTAELGFTTSRLLGWEAEVDYVRERHHLRVDVDDESAFWRSFDAGHSANLGAKSAGVSKSTAYRWIEKRYDLLRSAGHSVRQCQTTLRLTDARARIFEERRLTQLRHMATAARAAQHDATFSSKRYADRVLNGAVTTGQERLRVRAEKYWQLMRDGLSNAEACRLLGMHISSGTQLRQANDFQIPRLIVQRDTTGRYLDARERLQIADLLRLGQSMRGIAATLGRQPSTISRELARHRNGSGITCPRQPTTTHGCSVPGPRCPSSSPTFRCGCWCSES
ncbi:helix-turn-helix domain-containing protein [Cryobacterium lyxosi]|uniref:helix-turn-helix domain-containing protein n=1 Tax=Cryobacterium lyxosi TaxID=1259228 RepID=UPI001F542061|nr:helix-turn-helix domain-containing protein [Cryobacterium lyxosi]